MLNKQRRANRQAVIRLRMSHSLSGLANSGLTPDSYSKIARGAKEQYYDLLGTIMPWEGLGFVDHKKNELDEARQAYIDNFNVDPLDPDFKKWESGQVEKLKNGEFDDGPSAEDEAMKAVEERLRQRIVAGK